MAKKQTEIQAEYDKRQRERGLVRISVYVPADEKDRVRKYVKKLVTASLK